MNQPQPSDENDNTVDNPGKAKKDNDIQACSWNVTSLHRPYAAEQLPKLLKATNRYISAIKKCDGMKRA